MVHLWENLREVRDESMWDRTLCSVRYEIWFYLNTWPGTFCVKDFVHNDNNVQYMQWTSICISLQWGVFSSFWGQDRSLNTVRVTWVQGLTMACRKEQPLHDSTRDKNCWVSVRDPDLILVEPLFIWWLTVLNTANKCSILRPEERKFILTVKLLCHCMLFRGGTLVGVLVVVL